MRSTRRWSSSRGSCTAASRRAGSPPSAASPASTRSRRVLPISALRAHLPAFSMHCSARWSLPPHAVVEVRAATEVFHTCLRRPRPRGRQIRGEDAPPGLETAIRVSPRSSSARARAPPCAPWWRRRWRGSQTQRTRGEQGAGRQTGARGRVALATPHTRRSTCRRRWCILNFCLSAQPEPLMRIHAQLVGLLQEALALAENDDPTAIAGWAPGERRRRLHALARGVHSSDVQRHGVPRAQGARGGGRQEQLAQLRQRIITMFFKSPHVEVDGGCRYCQAGSEARDSAAELSQQGAAAVQLATNPCEPRALQEPYHAAPGGPERLLELLSNWFNPTLGESSSSTRRWLEPDAKAVAAGTAQRRALLPRTSRSPPR